MQVAETAGWYGKLPTLGDFASRRMDPGFVEAWDLWLSLALAEWRDSDAAGWRERYLAGPNWRFILMPDALPGLAGGGRAWAGVMAPSADRVGRCFPLTLVQPLQRVPAQGPQTEALLAWLLRLDDLAADALQERWSVDRLETALAQQGTWRAEGIMPGPAQHPYRHLHGHALWLRGDAQGCPRLHITQGLPHGSDFISLLAGTCATANAVHAVHALPATSLDLPIP